jgi:hypothetical protein
LKISEGAYAQVQLRILSEKDTLQVLFLDQSVSDYEKTKSPRLCYINPMTVIIAKKTPRFTSASDIKIWFYSVKV